VRSYSPGRNHCRWHIDPLFGRCAPPCLGKTHATVRDSGDAMMAGSRIFITAVTGAAIVCKLTSPELRCQEAVLRIGRTGRNPMTVITILQMPADASRISALRHPAVSSICRGLYRACPITPCSPIGALRQPGKAGPSPSAGLGGRFGEQPGTTPRFWMVSSGHSARFVCSGQAGIASRLSCSRVSTAGPRSRGLSTELVQRRHRFAGPPR